MGGLCGKQQQRHYAPASPLVFEPADFQPNQNAVTDPMNASMALSLAAQTKQQRRHAMRAGQQKYDKQPVYGLVADDLGGANLYQRRMGNSKQI